MDEFELKELQTTNEEKLRRITFCIACEHRAAINDVATCMQCACPIKFVTDYQFKICPVGKWE